MGQPQGAANLAKYGVPFEFAGCSPTCSGSSSMLHARRNGETRRKCVGRIDGRLFVVVFTDRSDARRIISARRANATERRAYATGAEDD